jgi:hypothetical protein
VRVELEDLLGAHAARRGDRGERREAGTRAESYAKAGSERTAIP